MNDKNEFRDSYYSFVGKVIVFAIALVMLGCLIPVIVKAL